jgi:N-methylhydantoinase A
VRARLIGVLDKPELPELAARPPGDPTSSRRVSFALGEWVDAPIYRRSALAPGQDIAGPAIIEQMDSTTPLHPGTHCRVDALGNLLITL